MVWIRTHILTTQQSEQTCKSDELLASNWLLQVLAHSLWLSDIWNNTDVFMQTLTRHFREHTCTWPIPHKDTRTTGDKMFKKMFSNKKFSEKYTHVTQAFNNCFCLHVSCLNIFV